MEYPTVLKDGYVPDDHTFVISNGKVNGDEISLFDVGEEKPLLSALTGHDGVVKFHMDIIYQLL